VSAKGPSQLMLVSGACWRVMANGSGPPSVCAMTVIVRNAEAPTIASPRMDREIRTLNRFIAPPSRDAVGVDDDGYDDDDDGNERILPRHGATFCKIFGSHSFVIAVRELSCGKTRSFRERAAKEGDPRRRRLAVDHSYAGSDGTASITCVNLRLLPS